MDGEELGFRQYTRDDGILVYEVFHYSPNALRAWANSVLALLENTQQPVKRLYDVRQAGDLPIRVLRVIPRLLRHPNIHWVSFAVVTSSSTVWGMLDLVLQARSKSTGRIMSNFEEAVAWLNERVPPTPTDGAR